MIEALPGLALRRCAVDLKLKDKRFNIWWEQEPLRPFGIGNWYSSSELRNITLTRLAKDDK